MPRAHIRPVGLLSGLSESHSQRAPVTLPPTRECVIPLEGGLDLVTHF